MKEPFERLKELRQKNGYRTAGDAARAYGWNELTYRSHENGTRGIKPAIAERYARAFRTSAEYILFGKSAPRYNAQTESNTFSSLQDAASQSPVYGCPTSGKARIAIIRDKVISYRAQSDATIGPNGFYIRVVDDSMEPKFEAGAYLAVNPDIPPAKGDPCAIETINNEVIVRQFISRNERELVCKQLTPPKTLRFNEKEIVRVSKIVRQEF
jgi:phage repressor protein C with HTH and peptisase S24 domain